MKRFISKFITTVIFILIIIITVTSCTSLTAVLKEKLHNQEVDNFISGTREYENSTVIDDLFTIKNQDKYYYYIFSKDIRANLSSAFTKFVKNNLSKNKTDFIMAKLDAFNGEDLNLKKGDRFSLSNEVLLGKFVYIYIRRYTSEDHNGNVIVDPKAITLEFIYVGGDNTINEIKQFTLTDFPDIISNLETKKKDEKLLNIQQKIIPPESKWPSWYKFGDDEDKDRVTAMNQGYNIDFIRKENKKDLESIIYGVNINGDFLSQTKEIIDRTGLKSGQGINYIKLLKDLISKEIVKKLQYNDIKKKEILTKDGLYKFEKVYIYREEKLKEIKNTKLVKHNVNLINEYVNQDDSVTTTNIKNKIIINHSKGEKKKKNLKKFLTFIDDYTDTNNSTIIDYRDTKNDLTIAKKSAKNWIRVYNDIFEKEKFNKDVIDKELRRKTEININLLIEDSFRPIVLDSYIHQTLKESEIKAKNKLSYLDEKNSYLSNIIGNPLKNKKEKLFARYTFALNLYLCQKYDETLVALKDIREFDFDNIKEKSLKIKIQDLQINALHLELLTYTYLSNFRMAHLYLDKLRKSKVSPDWLEGKVLKNIETILIYLEKN